MTVTVPGAIAREQGVVICRAKSQAWESIPNEEQRHEGRVERYPGKLNGLCIKITFLD